MKRWKGNPRLGIVLDKRSPMHSCWTHCAWEKVLNKLYTLYNSITINCIWSFHNYRILSIRLKKLIKSLTSLACGGELFHTTNEIQMLYTFHFHLNSSLPTPCMQMMFCQKILHRLLTISCKLLCYYASGRS